MHSHEMCYDRIADAIYVSGGYVVSGESGGTMAALYIYSCSTGLWRIVGASKCTADAKPPFRPRYSHTMQLDAPQRKLYIYSGRHCDDSLKCVTDAGGVH